jgi:hypothetical protein
LSAPPSASEAASPAAEAPARARSGVLQVSIWVGAVGLYAALGAWQPAVFLLGFWQAFPAVLGVTWVASRAARRLRG